MKKPRNYHALNAIQRSAAGPMRVKERPTNERDWEDIDWREDADYAHLNCSYCNPEEEMEK